METSKKYKWTLAGLIVMVLLNATILFSIWMDQNDRRDWRSQRDNNRDKKSGQQFMKNELGLSDEQSEKITSLRREHFGEIRELKKELETTRNAYMEYILMNESHDPAKRDSLVNVLTSRYAEIEESLYVHMLDIRKILDDDQAQRFKNFMQNHVHNDNNRKGKSSNRRN